MDGHDLDRLEKANRRLSNMLAMMREQRNEFLRKPKPGALGSEHSPETRKAMACLLDWYITSYGK